MIVQSCVMNLKQKTYHVSVTVAIFVGVGGRVLWPLLQKPYRKVSDVLNEVCVSARGEAYFRNVPSCLFFLVATLITYSTERLNQHPPC